jgi:hypothetical protein
VIDPPAKARHSTLMLLAAAELAGWAPEDIQQRALARYCFLYADSALEWLRRWRNQLKRDSLTARRARAAKTSISQLAEILDHAGGVRDYLAAKRQTVAAIRADDLEATARLWMAVNAANVEAICATAIVSFDTLSGEGTQDSITSYLGLPATYRRAVRDAFPLRDHSHWCLAADTAADLRLHTLPAAGGGEMGRRIAQINDVAAHLDTLLPIAAILEDALIYDWLVRSAIVVELSALLDLALGPPPHHPHNVIFSLLDLCHGERLSAAKADLDSLRDSIGDEGWDYVREARNRIGAHVDANLRMLEIHEHLLYLDYQGVTRLARHVLDWLDAIGVVHLDLRLLVLPERPIRSWPTDRRKPAPGRPEREVLTGSLARLFRRIDSPYMTVSGSSLGSAVIAGVTASRQPAPRVATTVKGRPPNRYLDPMPLKIA